MEEIEIWKDVKGFEDYYQISTYGRLRRKSRIVKMPKGGFRKYEPKIFSIKPITIQNRKYLYFRLCADNKIIRLGIHQISAMTFLNHEVGSTLVVDHIDNDSLNNNVNNLQVITLEENTGKDLKIGRSGVRGVIYNSNRKIYIAAISISKEVIQLGFSKNDIDYLSLLYKTALENKHQFNGNKKQFRNLIERLSIL